MHKGKNQTFQWLKCLAIIMVIDDHCSTRIGILSSLFPYNSFYMPLFVFISGYFYRKENILEFVQHKWKKLMCPYIIWSLIGLFLAFVLSKCTIVEWWKTPFNIKTLIQLLFSHPLSSITEPTWFAVMLFWVSVFYNCIKQVSFFNSKKGTVFLSFALLFYGFICLYSCMNWYPHGFRLFIIRTFWYMQFYHYGHLFKKIEEYFKKINSFFVCFICIIINVILICTNNDINFISTLHMGNFHSWYIPVVTSFTGILFWYEITSVLAEKIGKVHFIDFIANNTFSIMASHLFFVNIPNFYACNQKIKGNLEYADFPINNFISNAWVRYSSSSRLIGFFCGLIGSLLISYVTTFVKHRLEDSHKSIHS